MVKNDRFANLLRYPLRGPGAAGPAICDCFHCAADGAQNDVFPAEGAAAVDAAADGAVDVCGDGRVLLPKFVTFEGK